MSLLKIYSCYHPVLKKPTEPVTEMTPELRTLIDDMFDTMHNADGSGLAANQVGVSKSIVVIDVSYYEKKQYEPIAFINPRIVAVSDEEVDFEEGCLSIPGIYENVKRPKAVEVEYLDINMQPQRISDDDLLARVMQHEIDHLNATLFIEKISPLRRAMIKSKLKRIQKGDIDKPYEMIIK